MTTVGPRVAALASLLPCLLLVYNTRAWRGDWDLATLRTPRRFWEDISIAIAAYLDGKRPTGNGPVEIGSPLGQDMQDRYKRFVIQATAQEGIRAWELRRTIRVKPALNRGRIESRVIDDPGRASLSVLGFRVLRGVSPFLPLWLGVLAGLPVFLWTSWELARAGYPVAGIVFPLTLASSPFVVETLTLPYSAVGFYVVCLLALVPLAVFAFLGTRPSRVGLLVRALVAGLCLAVCVLCRSGSLLLVPGFVAAVLIAALRFSGPGPRRWTKAPAIGAALIAAVLVLAPCLILRQPGRHPAWDGIWEGLGDFDRTKGHTWYDPAARWALRGAGVEARPFDHAGPENAAIFRRMVIADISADPMWYATVLAKRVAATFGQTKLRPYGPRDGISMAPRDSPNEGVIDVYYRMTTTVDWLGFGPYRTEVPVALLWLPTLLLIVAWTAGRWLPGLRRNPDRAGPVVLVVVYLLANAMLHPVLITTASALETQAFAMFYFLGFSFLLDEVVQPTDRGRRLKRLINNNL